MDKKSFYITTAISYVNGSPHLGHAYEAIFTDVMARFKRLDGYDVMFLTGTDEHGEKIAKTAEKNGMKPLEFADQNAEKFINMTKLLNISNDDFIRTTEERHYKSVHAIWNRLLEKGDIYLDKYEGWYSVREEGYFAESELTECPNTGEKLTPNGTEVKWVEEPGYFFRLSAYTEKLLELYEKHPEFIQPESRRNEIISFVKTGLRDLSVSRDKKRLAWGIPVPKNNESDDEHVMYVWLDALTNYITAAGYPDTESEKFKKFWPADYHIIGKDIIRFHAVYWPAFLMSAGVDLPKTVFAHGFINVDGIKMSKSLGNVLSPEILIEKYGLDPLRYLLIREIPQGQDGNFTNAHAISRINSDLANGLGNLVQRTLSFIYKNCDGVIPECGELTEEDKSILNHAYVRTLPAVRREFDEHRMHKAIEAIWSLVDASNVYIDHQAPWTLKKENPERMKTVLYVLVEAIRCIALLSQPVMPESSSKILDQLGVGVENRGFDALCKDFALKSGNKIEKPVGVFPRIVEKEEAA